MFIWSAVSQNSQPLLSYVFIPALRAITINLNHLIPVSGHDLYCGSQGQWRGCFLCLGGVFCGLFCLFVYFLAQFVTLIWVGWKLTWCWIQSLWTSWHIFGTQGKFLLLHDCFVVCLFFCTRVRFSLEVGMQLPACWLNCHIWKKSQSPRQ